MKLAPEPKIYIRLKSRKYRIERNVELLSGSLFSHKKINSRRVTLFKTKLLKITLFQTYILTKKLT